jgi:hypothetical protein
MGMESIVQGLTALQSQMRALQDVLDDVQRGIPPSIQGSDRSGSVTAELGADGFPRAVAISSGWQRRIRPSDLGAAVCEASQDAMARRVAAWSAAFSRMDVPSLIAARRSSAESGEPAQDPAGAGAGRSEWRNGPPRPVDSVVEDALALLDTAAGSVGRVPRVPSGRGTGGRGMVVVVLNQRGLTSCEVDERWAAHEDSGRISTACNDALTRARADLAEALDSDAGSESAQGRALVEELLGLVRELGQRPENLTGGDR